MNIRMHIVEFQLKLLKFFKSKSFWFLVFLIMLAFFINLFTANEEVEVTMDFDKYDKEQFEEATKQVEDTYEITMGEVNRNAKLITSFFNELLINKTYFIKGISEDYEDILDYDLQIVDIKKTLEGYDVLVQVLIRDYSQDERQYVPYKMYIVNVLSTVSGLKVDYISIVE